MLWCLPGFKNDSNLTSLAQKHTIDSTVSPFINQKYVLKQLLCCDWNNKTKNVWTFFEKWVYSDMTCTWPKYHGCLGSYYLSRVQVVPGLFLELLLLLGLLLWLLFFCFWVAPLLLLLQLHALLEAAGSPHAALQPAVTTSSALSHHRLQFGCSEGVGAVTREQKNIENTEKKKTKRNKKPMRKTKKNDEEIIACDFMQKSSKANWTCFITWCDEVTQKNVKSTKQK